MANNKLPKQSDQMDNFTRAVKTIVSVPKDAIGKPGDKLKDENVVWECPDCGFKMKVYKPDSHNHGHDTKK